LQQNFIYCYGYANLYAVAGHRATRDVKKRLWRYSIADLIYQATVNY
jgi:hypothetical protein